MRRLLTPFDTFEQLILILRLFRLISDYIDERLMITINKNLEEIYYETYACYVKS